MGERQFNVLTYCKSGRHRSVAAAHILAHLLQGEGFVVEAPQHLCDFWWFSVPCQRRYRGGCWECTRAISAQKAALYAEVAAYWHSW